MMVLMKVLGRTKEYIPASNGSPRKPHGSFIVQPMALVEHVSTEEAIAALETLRAIAAQQRSVEVVHEK